MKRFSGALAALAMATAFGSPALADTTLNVHYPMPGFFKDVMADISKKFMEENPDIKINFVSPSATYEEGIQTIMRQAGTSEMPDITFTGLNRLRVLAERNIGVDMKPLVEKNRHGSAGLHRSPAEPRPRRRPSGRPCFRNLQPNHVLQRRSSEGGRRQSRQSPPPGTK